MTTDQETVRHGPDGRSARISATTSAAGHLLRRTLAPVDLSAHDELRLWLRSDRVGDGTGERPFFLELKLGSAARGLTDPSNTWHRLLPARERGAWELVRLGLSDLPADIRSGLTAMQLRCVDASASFTCYVDEVTAIREEMLVDVEAALQARLHERLAVSGKPVPALVHASGVAETATPPYILLTQYDVSYADTRTSTTPERRDFTSTGYKQWPPSTGWDLFYQVEVFAQDRPTQARLLGFVLEGLGPRGELLVNGDAVLFEMVSVPPEQLVGGMRTDRLSLHYRVQARQRAGVARPVAPVRSLSLVTDVGVG